MLRALHLLRVSALFCVLIVVHCGSICTVQPSWSHCLKDNIFLLIVGHTKCNTTYNRPVAHNNNFSLKIYGCEIFRTGLPIQTVVLWVVALCSILRRYQHFKSILKMKAACSRNAVRWYSRGNHTLNVHLLEHLWKGLDFDQFIFSQRLKALCKNSYHATCYCAFSPGCPRLLIHYIFSVCTLRMSHAV
jgi:hypothetical protein